jgi:copper chaperone CopZ
MALAEVMYDSKRVLPKQLLEAVAQAGNDGRHEYRAQLLATE